MRPTDPAPEPRSIGPVTVVAMGRRHAAAAERWGARLGAGWAVDDASKAPAGHGLRLEVDDRGLALRDGDGPVVRVDMGAYARARRPGRDLLARAVGASAESVVDATAGLGRDAFHLASIGKRVTLIERSRLIAALLEDALERAQVGEGAEAASRMRLVAGEAIDYLLRVASSEDERPDVVYLDPMYPHRGKTALPGKGMALFRDLVGPDADAPQLLRAARAAARKRVVVKRPAAAPPLAGPSPSGALVGSTTRYDIYAPAPP